MAKISALFVSVCFALSAAGGFATADREPCPCALFYSCLRRASTDGTGILVPRAFPNDCEKATETCCLQELNEFLRIDDGFVGRIRPVEGNCTCVPFFLCQNERLVDDGEGVLEGRSRSPCADRSYVCCPTSNKPRRKRSEFGCGVRNRDGVGGHVTYTGLADRAQFGEFPWTVQVWFGKKFLGAGTLIHPEIVLTAAHILENAGDVSVRAGVWKSDTADADFPSVDAFVAVKSVHPQFNKGNFRFDAALLFLDRPVPLGDHIDIACLPPEGVDPSPAPDCLVAGWGKRDSRSANRVDIMKKLNATVIPREECEDILKETRLGPGFNVHETFICAIGRDGKDVCSGDGGGPLACPIPDTDNRYTQVGIIASGLDCGESNVPSLYTNVAFVRGWIDSEAERHLSRGLDT